MSIDWFRSWHGAPTDPKWLLIARNAVKRNETHETQITPGMVSAVVWALFDCASQAEQRGNIESFDVETYAVFSGFKEMDITAVIDEMKEKRLIVSGCLSAWEKRQPKREDNSTERVREHRNAMKRSVTQGNAREDKEESREENKDAAVAAFPSDEKQLYDLGKQLLGSSSGGVIKKLVTAKDGSIPLARAALEVARTKSDPREYLGAIIRNRDGGEKSQWAF